MENNTIRVTGKPGPKRRGSARAVADIQSRQRGKLNIGKILQLNNEYVILFRKVAANDIISTDMICRKADYDKLKISTIRIPSELYFEDPDTGRIDDNSGLDKWAKLSNILYTAEERMEIAAAEEEATKEAEQTGIRNDLALKQKIDRIKTAYEGKPKEGDLDAVKPTKNRMLSSNPVIQCLTECVVIRLDRELNPVWKEAQAAEVQLSPTKLRNLFELLDNPMYNDLNDDDGWLQVKFSYHGKDRKEAGTQKYQGLEPSIRKVKFEVGPDGKYVDPNVESIRKVLDAVCTDPEIMYQRSNAVNYANKPADFVNAARSYLANQRLLPTYIDFEDDYVKKNAKMILDLGCVVSPGSKQFAMLEAMIEEDESDETTENVATPDGMSEFMGAAISDRVKMMDANEALANMVADEEIADIP